jgi:hypothetical protein
MPCGVLSISSLCGSVIGVEHTADAPRAYAPRGAIPTRSIGPIQELNARMRVHSGRPTLGAARREIGGGDAHVGECIRDEALNASDGGDLASRMCGDPDTTLSIDDPPQALAPSYEATGP